MGQPTAKGDLLKMSKPAISASLETSIGCRLLFSVALLTLDLATWSYGPQGGTCQMPSMASHTQAINSTGASQEPEWLRFQRESCPRTQWTQGSLLIQNSLTSDGCAWRQEPLKFMECPKTAAKDTFSQGARPLARVGIGCTGTLRKALLLLFLVVQTPKQSWWHLHRECPTPGLCWIWLNPCFSGSYSPTLSNAANPVDLLRLVPLSCGSSDGLLLVDYIERPHGIFYAEPTK